MRNGILLALVLIYIIYEAVDGYLSVLKLKDTVITETRRIKMYKSAIINGWIPVALIAGAVLFSDITLSDIGLNMISLNYSYFGKWLTIGILSACVVLQLLLIYEITAFKTSQKYRTKLDQQVRQKNERNLLVVLPSTKREKRWWSYVAATAGIGEEILYRGFILYLLTSLFPGFPAYLILIGASIFFGVAHFYQGLTGVIKTGLTGIILSMLYFATGSIFPGIILHFTMDYAANFMLVDRESAPI